MLSVGKPSVSSNLVTHNRIHTGRESFTCSEYESFQLSSLQANSPQRTTFKCLQCQQDVHLIGHQKNILGKTSSKCGKKKKPNKTLTFLPIREAMLVKNCVYVLSMAKTLVGEPYLGLYPKKQKLV